VLHRSGRQRNCFQYVERFLAAAEGNRGPSRPEAAGYILIIEVLLTIRHEVAASKFAGGAQRLRTERHVRILNRRLHRLAGIDPMHDTATNADATANGLRRCEQRFACTLQKLRGYPAKGGDQS